MYSIIVQRGDKMDVLERIEQLRKQRGWSQYKLATEAGLTQSTLANMFSRRTQPSISTLSLICDAFGISLAQFFANDEDAKTILDLDEIRLIKSYRTLTHKNKKAVLSLCENLEDF